MNSASERTGVADSLPQNNTNTLESEARRMGNSVGRSVAVNRPQNAQQQFVGTIDWAKKNAVTGHWNGVITYNGREKIFFHTSMSTELDLSTLALKKGVNVRFTIGKNKKNNEPIACDLRF